MIRYWSARAGDRRRVKVRVGTHPARVPAAGHGSRDLRRAAPRLDDYALDVEVIVADADRRGYENGTRRYRVTCARADGERSPSGALSAGLGLQPFLHKLPGKPLRSVHGMMRRSAAATRAPRERNEGSVAMTTASQWLSGRKIAAGRTARTRGRFDGNRSAAAFGGAVAAAWRRNARAGGNALRPRLERAEHARRFPRWRFSSFRKRAHRYDDPKSGGDRTGSTRLARYERTVWQPAGRHITLRQLSEFPSGRRPEDPAWPELRRDLDSYDRIIAWSAARRGRRQQTASQHMIYEFVWRDRKYWRARHIRRRIFAEQGAKASQTGSCHRSQQGRRRIRRHLGLNGGSAPSQQ